MGIFAEPKSRWARRRFTETGKRELAAFLASGRRISIPQAERDIEITVAVVVYNQAHLTLPCLEAIAAQDGVRFETVLIDNASSDDTGALLDRTDGLRVTHNEDNVGFLLAVNQAAALARGEFFLMLNNDAVMEPDALRRALDRLRSDPKIGAVGGKLILLSGLLQEAGSIIWRLAGTYGYGRGHDPGAPEFQFVREVDYCAGAFLMTRRALFDRLGRFDEAFAPIYYEETDYCARLRQAGFKVVYDPKIRVHHFEYGSASGRHEMMARNRQLLLEKHRDYLAPRLVGSPRNRLRARDLRPVEARVLMIEDRVPHARLGAGLPRAAQLVRAVRDAVCFATFYPLDPKAEDWDEVYRTLPEDVEVMVGGSPWRIAWFIARRRGYYDAILVARPYNLSRLLWLRRLLPWLFGGVRLIYDSEGFHGGRALRAERLAGAGSNSRPARRGAAAELRRAALCDRVIAVSEREAAIFREAGCRSVEVAGYAPEVRPSKAPFERRAGILFVGALADPGSPNAEGVGWFAHEVLPILKKSKMGAADVRIAGALHDRVRATLEPTGMALVGPVEDLGPLYEAARVFVAPTRIAGGIALKVIDAAARGLPVVTTPLVAELLGWKAGTELLTADDPEAFAAACVRLHGDKALWTKVRKAALARIAQDHGAARFGEAVARSLAGLGGRAG